MKISTYTATQQYTQQKTQQRTAQKTRTATKIRRFNEKMELSSNLESYYYEFSAIADVICGKGSDAKIADLTQRYEESFGNEQQITKGSIESIEAYIEKFTVKGLVERHYKELDKESVILKYIKLIRDVFLEEYEATKTERKTIIELDIPLKKIRKKLKQFVRLRDIKSIPSQKFRNQFAISHFPVGMGWRSKYEYHYFLALFFKQPPLKDEGSMSTEYQVVRLKQDFSQQAAEEADILWTLFEKYTKERFEKFHKQGKQSYCFGRSMNKVRELHPCSDKIAQLFLDLLEQLPDYPAEDMLSVKDFISQRKRNISKAEAEFKIICQAYDETGQKCTRYGVIYSDWKQEKLNKFNHDIQRVKEFTIKKIRRKKPLVANKNNLYERLLCQYPKVSVLSKPEFNIIQKVQLSPEECTEEDIKTSEGIVKKYGKDKIYKICRIIIKEEDTGEFSEFTKLDEDDYDYDEVDYKEQGCDEFSEYTKLDEDDYDETVHDQTGFLDDISKEHMNRDKEPENSEEEAAEKASVYELDDGQYAIDVEAIGHIIDKTMQNENNLITESQLIDWFERIKYNLQRFDRLKKKMIEEIVNIQQGFLLSQNPCDKVYLTKMDVVKRLGLFHSSFITGKLPVRVGQWLEKWAAYDNMSEVQLLQKKINEQIKVQEITDICKKEGISIEIFREKRLEGQKLERFMRAMAIIFENQNQEIHFLDQWLLTDAKGIDIKDQYGHFVYDGGVKLKIPGHFITEKIKELLSNEFNSDGKKGMTEEKIAIALANRYTYQGWPVSLSRATVHKYLQLMGVPSRKVRRERWLARNS